MKVQFTCEKCGHVFSFIEFPDELRGWWSTAEADNLMATKAGAHAQERCPTCNPTETTRRCKCCGHTLSTVAQGTIYRTPDGIPYLLCVECVLGLGYASLAKDA